MKQGLLPNKDTQTAKPPHKRGSAERIVSILRMSAAGRTQQAIAEELGITQSAVSLTLAKYARNTTKDARQILEAKAADMALNVARNGRPADQLRALEGLNVIDLREKQPQGLSITINGFALVGLGLQGESGEKAQQIGPGSDKETYVNEANSLTMQDIPAQERKGSEANPALLEAELVGDSEGGPTPEGNG